MARLRIEPAGITLDVDLQAERRVLDLCDDHPEAGVPFSCRAANCGTCRVRVLEGDDLFAPADEDELAVLDLFGNLPQERLACQLELIRDGDATLEVCEP